MYFGNLLLSPQVFNLFLQSWLKHSPKIPVQFFTSLSISSIHNSLYIILCICAFSPSPHTHPFPFSLSLPLSPSVPPSQLSFSLPLTFALTLSFFLFLLSVNQFLDPVISFIFVVVVYNFTTYFYFIFTIFFLVLSSCVMSFLKLESFSIMQATWPWPPAKGPFPDLVREVRSVQHLGHSTGSLPCPALTLWPSCNVTSVAP